MHSMRPKFAAVVLGILALKCLTVAWAAPADNETVPLTMMAEVDLRGAVHFLAEQVGLNCILDTCIPGSYYGVGRGMRAPEVSVRFENKTSEYVFYFVLRKYQLTVVTNPATTVARIVPAGHWVKPVPVTPSLSDTNGLLTKMNLNGTLAEVIETAAKAANLKAVFDSQFSSSEYVQRATLDSFHQIKVVEQGSQCLSWRDFVPVK